MREAIIMFFGVVITGSLAATIAIGCETGLIQVLFYSISAMVATASAITKLLFNEWDPW